MKTLLCYKWKQAKTFVKKDFHGPNTGRNSSGRQIIKNKFNSFDYMF